MKEILSYIIAGLIIAVILATIGQFIEEITRKGIEKWKEKKQ